MNKLILITSVGSLVGQNVLDSLQNRRSNIKIIGTNSMAEAANNFRCDKLYLVSEAASKANFIRDLSSVIETEDPELIIPGRDDDVVILAQLSKKMPKYKDRFLVGSEQFAKAMDDKILSYNFAQKYNLPFAPTIESGKTGSSAKARELLKEFGFPLIAKPSKGNGSRGIWVVVNEDQLKKVSEEHDFSIQPFFRTDPEFSVELDTSLGLPFFWEIPENRLYAAQTIISKDQKVEEIFSFVAKMVYGKCERMDVYTDSELTKIVRNFVDAAILEGWRGPFNIQLKYDYKHGFQVIEMNGRFSGGTSARRYLGFDEVGRTINDWTEDDVIPNVNPRKDKKVVTKILADYEINLTDVDNLKRDKVWRM